MPNDPHTLSEEPRKYNVVNEEQFNLLIDAFNKKGSIPKTLADVEMHYNPDDERGEPEMASPVDVIKPYYEHPTYSNLKGPGWVRHRTWDESKRSYDKEGIDSDAPNRDVNLEFDSHTASLGVFPDLISHSHESIRGPIITSPVFDVNGKRMVVDYDIHGVDLSLQPTRKAEDAGESPQIPHIEEESSYLKRLKDMGYRTGMVIPSAENRDLFMERQKETFSEPVGRSGHFHQAAGTLSNDLDAMLNELRPRREKP